MIQDEYSAAFELVEKECGRQLRDAQLPAGIEEALSERGLLFGEHPEVMAILPLLVFRAVGGKNLREAAPVGAAMEFLLAAADILDDVQDRYIPDDARQPDRLQDHYINEMELFTALMLLGEQSVISLMDEDVDPRRARKAISIFNTFKLRSFSGQYSDAHGKVHPDGNLESSIAITRGKCGSLARCSAQMGAVLGTADQTAIDLVGEYAEHLAIARQLHDDVSNLWPGTGRGEDLEQLKNTMPLAFPLLGSGEGSEDRVSSLRTLVNLDRAVGPQVEKLPVGSEIAKARKEIFSSGGIHFALLQSSIHLVKARTLGRRIEKLAPGEGTLERLASS